MIGFYTLLRKEVLRFWRVGFQTISAPILTALLYQLIFAQAMGGHVQTYPGISYGVFLIPGLAMMSMTQNAFANASSSIIQSKITGNIIFILLPPLSIFDVFFAYLIAAVLRGLLVGVGVILVTIWFGLPYPYNPLWIFIFALLGCATLGTFGIIAGIFVEKFDQLAVFQNFIIMPLTFLSGVFYSIKSLPHIWRVLSHANPVFYMIDGFRYGFFGHSDASPWLSLSVISIGFVFCASFTLYLLKTGYKLRS